MAWPDLNHDESNMMASRMGRRAAVRPRGEILAARSGVDKDRQGKRPKPKQGRLPRPLWAAQGLRSALIDELLGAYLGGSRLTLRKPLSSARNESATGILLPMLSVPSHDAVTLP